MYMKLDYKCSTLDIYYFHLSKIRLNAFFLLNIGIFIYFVILLQVKNNLIDHISLSVVFNSLSAEKKIIIFIRCIRTVL